MDINLFQTLSTSCNLIAVWNLYDTIGDGYSPRRRPDPSIARAICEALDNSTSVVNVGAGTGSYEPTDRFVVSAEPSRTMINQRTPDSGAVVRASATALPFADESFDAALAILTVHHWNDQALGLSELRRVASDRLVIFTWNPDYTGFWLEDYFPEIFDLDRTIFPTVRDFENVLGNVEVVNVPIPHDCTDGFLCAYWRRPHAYLDSAIRSGMSTFSKVSQIGSGLTGLRSDLSSGVWRGRYGGILELDCLDLGYCLVVAEI